MENWKITRYGASKGREDTRINNEIKGGLSRNRITVSLHYVKHSLLSANQKIAKQSKIEKNF
jgi:hypothetical protein